MASYPIRAGWFNFPVGGGHFGPPALRGVPTNAAAVVSVPFDESLRTGPALAQFTATVAGSARTVSAVAVSGTDPRVLLVTLASAPTAGQAVVVTYTKGGTAGTRLADVNGEEVATGVIASYTA